MLLFALAAVLAVTPSDIAQRVQQERLVAHLHALPTARAADGDREHVDGLRRTEDLLFNTLTDLGYAPLREPFSYTPRTRAASADQPARSTWHNIIAELPGTDLPREVYIIGAHFDAVPGSPGADDNGSAVAALLELARVLKDTPMRRTVRMVFFNCEEVGLVGSRAHLANLQPRLADDHPDHIIIKGMISLEMLGYYSDAPGSQRSPIKPIPGVFEPPTVGDTIVIATIAGAQSFSRPLDAAMRAAEPAVKTFLMDFAPVPFPDLLRSDHGPFLLAGLPALMLTDTANFRNPHYHEPTDTIDTLDLPRYTTTVRAVAGAIFALAEPAQK